MLAAPFRREEQLHTFSVGFEEKGFDESHYAHRVAKQVGATHHALIVSERDYVNQLDETVRQVEEPLSHANSVQLQLLSRHAKSFVTVVLTGEGADELFGGYPRQQIPLLARKLRMLPEVLSTALRHAAALFGLRRIMKLLDASATEAEAVINGARFVSSSDFERLFPGARAFAPRQGIYDELAGSDSDLHRTHLAIRSANVSAANLDEARQDEHGIRRGMPGAVPRQRGHRLQPAYVAGPEDPARNREQGCAQEDRSAGLRTISCTVGKSGSPRRSRRGFAILAALAVTSI